MAGKSRGEAGRDGGEADKNSNETGKKGVRATQEGRKATNDCEKAVTSTGDTGKNHDEPVENRDVSTKNCREEVKAAAEADKNLRSVDLAAFFMERGESLFLFALCLAPRRSFRAGAGVRARVGAGDAEDGEAECGARATLRMGGDG